ncbi:MAG: DUF4837 family protein [Ignavibacteria bacterium]|nr:DUF4837 family protein [Ignavibacteria bacterium]
MFRCSNFRFSSLLLLLSLIFISCNNQQPESSGKLTDIQIITDETVTGSQKGIVDSVISTVSLDGMSEPFFESVTFIKQNFDKTPSGKNLLIFLRTSSSLMNQRFKSIFRDEVISRAEKGSEPVIIRKENLFFNGQTVWFLIYGREFNLDSFLTSSSVSLIQKIKDNCLSTSRSEKKPEKYEKEISDSVKLIHGIDFKIPVGFEAALPLNKKGFSLLRRGAGTKTEEWILIAEITDTISNYDTSQIIKIRDVVIPKAIVYRDGSVMKTGRLLLDSIVINSFRGDWTTSPYPMAGVFTGRILKLGTKVFYIEAGIYSPGRPKTLNLLRLENMIRNLP